MSNEYDDAARELIARVARGERYCDDVKLVVDYLLPWKAGAIQLLARWRTAPRTVCQARLAFDTDNFVGADCPAYDEALRQGGATPPPIDDAFPNPSPQPTELEAECERLRAATASSEVQLSQLRAEAGRVEVERNTARLQSLALSAEVERLRAQRTYVSQGGHWCARSETAETSLAGANALLHIVRVEVAKHDEGDGEQGYPDSGTTVNRIRAHLAGALPAAGGEYPPPAAAINALPANLRRWIHQLEADADPAGNVRDAAAQRENAAALAARVDELAARLLETNNALGSLIQTSDARIAELEAALAVHRG